MFKKHYRGGPRAGQFRTNSRGREGEGEKSLLKYSDSRPSRAELHEISKKLKSYAIYKIITSCNIK